MMPMNRRGRKLSLRLFAGFLAAGLLMAEPNFVFAEDAIVCETGQTSVQARIPESGEIVEISENVRIMLGEGSIYLDESTGFLIHTATGLRVHPISGEQEAVSEPAWKYPDSGCVGK